MLFLVLGSIASASDALPRRGLLGVGTVDTSGAVTINAVLPGLPGAQAGLQTGDVITSVGRDWLEYELLNSRRWEALAGANPADIDKALLLKEDCMHRMLVEKTSHAELLRQKPECADYTSYPAPDAYVQELAPLNIAEPWMKVAVPVLAIYGSGDFITDEADHRRIVDIVNGVHPGSALVDVIPGMDHYLTPAGSPRASFDRVARKGAAPYDIRFSAAVLDWLCERERCLPATS